MKAKVQDKKNPFRTNPKGPIRLCVPKSKIIFASYMFQGRSKATVLVPGQWLLTTYDRRKAYYSNPSSERGKNCGFRGNQKGRIIGTCTIGNSSI